MKKKKRELSLVKARETFASLLKERREMQREKETKTETEIEREIESERACDVYRPNATRRRRVLGCRGEGS